MMPRNCRAIADPAFLRRARRSRRPLRTVPGVRPGTTIVEATLVLPLLLTIVFGAIEFGSLFHARHSMLHAAREAARMLAVQGTTVEEAEAFALSTLPGDSGDYAFTAEVPEQDAAERDVTVALSVPLDEIGIGCVGGLTGQSTLTVQVVMRSER